MSIPDDLDDLFFNYEHPTYDKVMEDACIRAKATPTTDDIRAAVLQDAAEFVAAYPRFVEGATADELADAFMRRY